MKFLQDELLDLSIVRNEDGMALPTYAIDRVQCLGVCLSSVK